MRIKILPPKEENKEINNFKQLDEMIDKLKDNEKEIIELKKQNKIKKIAIIVSLTLNLIGALYVYHIVS